MSTFTANSSESVDGMVMTDVDENDIGNVDKHVKFKYSFLKYLFIILALSLCM